MPPRRRKNSESLQRPGKKQRTEEVYSLDCLFCELLEKHGFILSAGEGKNKLNVDQEILQRNLTTSLKQQLGKLDESVDEFLDGFSNYIEEPSRFRKSLMPSTTADECETARSNVQESLVRILLGIDIIQPKLINVLLEKLPEFMGDDDNVMEQGEKINVPRLLLNQLRWLSRIVCSRDLTKKLLEMVAVTSLEVQKEIISVLPEVVEDSEHGEVANTLKQLLVDGNQLTIVILDALSNLTLSKDVLAEVQSSALRTLKSVYVEDLPVVVNFLMQTITAQDALEVISELRANIDFDTFIPTATKTSKKGGKSGAGNSVADCKVLTADAIKMGICSMKSVAEAWMKTIEAVRSSKDHKVIDLVALFILHNVSRKPTESLFRNKIRAGAFSEALLKSTLGNHIEMLREYFPSLLSLAETFLRSPEPAIVHFAQSMFRYAFLSFDSFYRQEVVGTLVTHASSGLEGEVDAALDVLTELVQQHLASMAPYTIFIKGILDCLDKLTMMQIRKLYSMLSQLAFLQPEHGSAVQDDLFIIIRKQLSTNSPKYRRMGVIGAIMVVKSLGFARGGPGKGVDAEGASGSKSKASASKMSEETYKQVIQLLQMVNQSSSHVPEAAALFMDELSAVVSQGQLHPQVLQWISDNMISDFQDEFVIDFEESKSPECSLLPMAQLYNLNGDDDNAIGINLLPLVAESIKRKSQLLPLGKKKAEKVTDPTYLGPLFRLVQVCEYQQNDGVLEGIDALLGCPVFAVDEKAFDKLESLSAKEKEAACTLLFHLLNWFREVVNAFATQDDVEMKGKVIMRLQNITHLQAILEKCLPAVPGFCPPPANFDLDNNLKPPAPPAPTGSGEKKKGRKGKKKAKENADPSQVEDHDEDSTSQMEKGSQMGSQTQNRDSSEKKDSPTVDLANYQQFFRELDVGVFTILSTGLISRADLDSNLNTKTTEVLKIQPPQLKFLLDDLLRKMNHSLLASASKRRTFLKVKVEKNMGFSHLDQLGPAEFAAKVVEFLPSLCDHLEGTSAFFQNLAAKNDGMIDGPGTRTPEAEMMGSCFSQLLHILHSLFSWTGFSTSENTPLFKKALSVLVQRIRVADSSQPSLQDLLQGAFQYIQNFSDTSPSLPTAVILVKLLVCLHEKLGEGDQRERLAGLARGFLQREWLGPNGEALRGARHHENLFPIIRTFLLCSEDTMAAMESLALQAIPELLKADKDGCSSSFPSLTRPAFAVFYRVLFAELVEIVKGIQVGKQRESQDVKLDKLLRWSTAVRILHVLINVVKSFDARAHLACCLKYGRQFIEAFLRQGMPLLDQIFHSHQSDVHGLLRNLQISTRSLHHMCGHSKIVRDTVLTNQVPELKRVLEMLVYRVKAMLTVNGCLEAFWMGNLKNRDLHGEEILSQVTPASQQSSSDQEEEEEEENLADSEESEVEMDNQSESGDNNREENARGDRESLSQAF